MAQRSVSLGFLTQSGFFGVASVSHRAGKLVCSLPIQNRVRACAAPHASLVVELPESLPTTLLRSERPDGSILLESLQEGDELVGKVSHVGGADSLWLNLDVIRPARKGAWKFVRGRLRFEKELSLDDDGKATWSVVTPREKHGDKIQVKVKKVDTGTGRLEVVRKKPTRRKSPKVKLLKKRKRLTRIVAEGGRRLDELSTGDELAGTVFALGKYGALIDCGVVREGSKQRMFAAYALLQRKRFPKTWCSDADLVKRTDAERTLRVGDALTVYVRQAHPANGFLWVSATPVTVDELQAEQRLWRASIRRSRRRDSPESLTVGERRKGSVRDIVKYGAFVDIGISTDALLHYTDMKEVIGSEWQSSLSIGDAVDVAVARVDGTRVNVELVRLGGDMDSDMNEGDVDTNNPMARPVGPKGGAFSSSGDSTNTSPAPSEKTPKMNRTRGITGAKNDQSSTSDADSSSSNLDDVFTDDYLEDKYGY